MPDPLKFRFQLIRNRVWIPQTMIPLHRHIRLSILSVRTNENECTIRLSQYFRNTLIIIMLGRNDVQDGTSYYYQTIYLPIMITRGDNVRSVTSVSRV